MQALKAREEMNSKDLWNLSNLYASDEAWEVSYEKALAEIDKVGTYQGKLGESAQLLEEALTESNRIGGDVARLYNYAGKRHHQDTTNPTYQAMESKAESLGVKAGTISSYMVPEILGIGEAKLQIFMKENPALEIYAHYFHDIVRVADHILTPEKEELMAQISEVAAAPGAIFSMINNADLKFEPVADKDGEMRPLTHGNFIQHLESKDRVLRENAYNAFYAEFRKLRNTIAKTFSSSVKGTGFDAKVRNYGSSLEAALFGDNIPVDIYKNLVETVNDNLGLMHDYVSVRKNILGLDELKSYDLYVPIVESGNINIDYDSAKETIIASLAPMGEEYLGLIKRAFDEQWIDVYENKGKRPGAYSWGSYGTHPHILMNYDDRIKSMFTLTHELGHALHSYYTGDNQPQVYGGYTIFLAEIASTVNEALLMDYLLKTTKDENTKKYILNYYMENFRGTLFRQTMFAEFEMVTHQMDADNVPLTVDALNEVYKGLVEKYFGKDLVTDENIAHEWARIPHFYRPFYVFQYATGFSSAIAISKAILTEGQPAVARYVNSLLKGGSSDYSIEILKRAGVDMTTKAPIEAAMKVFGEVLAQFKGM